MSDSTLRRWRWAATAILAVSLAVRLAYVLLVVGEDPPAGDAIYYSAQAEVISRGGFFEHPFTGAPAADHPPVTALILALPSIGPGDPLFEQRLFMAVLGTAGVAAIMALGREVAGRSTALLAGALAAVHPGLWINDGLAMSETPTTVITAVVLLVGIRWRRGAVPSWLLGVLGGIAVLTRAELVLLVGLLALPFGLPGPAGERWRRMALVAAFGALALAPWSLWNLTRFEEPVAVSTNDGLTLLGSNCDPSYGDGLGFWHLQCAPPVPGDQSEVSSEYRRMAVEYVGEHLDEVPEVVAARLGRAWGLYRPMDQVYLNQGEGRPIGASRLAMWSWYPLAAFAAAGAVVLHRRRGPWWPLLLPFVTVTVTVVLTYGIPRFRLPAEVAAIVLAAVAIEAVARRVLRADPAPAPAP